MHVLHTQEERKYAIKTMHAKLTLFFFFFKCVVGGHIQAAVDKGS